MDKNFWQGKRVFLTGSSGFKGRWLTTWLQMLGAEVIGYSFPNNVTDYNLLSYVYRDCGANIIIHLAAQAFVKKGYTHPFKTFDTNITGTLNVLTLAKYTTYTRATLIITSDKAGTGDTDPYSTSKSAASLITTSYRESFGLNVSEARAGNVIGGRDWGEDRLIPDIMRAKQSGEKLKLRNPDAVRPWQYVLECLDYYMTIVERMYDDPTYASIYTIGPKKADTTVLDIVKFFKCPYEVVKGDFKERDILTIEPDLPTEFTTQQALEWTKAGYDYENTMESQIEKYMNFADRFANTRFAQENQK